LLHENALADNDLLRKNDAAGDDFTKPRDVDFAFKTNERSRAEDICEYINGKNLGSATVQESEGTFWVVAVIHMPITQNVLCNVSAFMVCLSRLFQVEYDCGGSIIQKP
jgi:hypothetical protein